MLYRVWIGAYFYLSVSRNLNLLLGSQGKRKSWALKFSRGLYFYLIALFFSAGVQAAPSTQCIPNVRSISVSSGGTIDWTTNSSMDLSSCSVFGLSGVSVQPSHGSLPNVNSSTGNATGFVRYVNNGDSATSDTFTVLDDSNGTVTYNVTITSAGITLSPTSLTAATVATSYSRTITATGGSGSYTFAISAGALPAGVTLSSAGLLSGTPTAGGTFNFTVRATDTASTSGTQAYTLTVNAPTITVAPTTLTAATVGSSYSQTVTASGGTATYTYAVTAGSLPSGMSLSSGGVLSGTPTAGGTFNFTVQATDSSTGTGPYTGSRAYSLTVNAPTIALSPTTLTAATVGSSYSQTVTASGGTATYTYAVTAGALPSGMSLSSGGVLSGTPTAGGTFNFTMQATDSSTGTGPYTGSRAYSLTVNAPTIALSPTTLTAATVGSSYSQTVTASGGTATYTYAVTAGSLPSGMSLSSGGVLSGTPTAGGTFNFTVQATDSSTGAGPYTGSRAYSLTVNAPTINLSPTTLTAAAVGVSYSQTVTANGGIAAYTYAIAAGALPTGLTLSSSGVLSGTPTVGGTFNFTVQATDSSTGAGPYTGAQAYSLNVGGPTISLAPTSLTAATVGSSYNQTITASGGNTPYTYVISAGALPAGMSLSSGGMLSGTPTAGGTFTFTVQATDSSGGAGPYTGSQAYTLTVNAPSISLAPTTLVAAAVGVSYSQTITASGGIAAYTYAVTAGALPAGLTLSSSGVLSGTPTASGTFNFTVQAADSSGGAGPYTGSQAYTLTVGVPIISLSPTTLGTTSVGSSYAQTLTASGGVAPYTYTLSAGALPAGMSLSSSGVLAGTPTTSGTFNFTIEATDSAGSGPYSGLQSYSLVVTGNLLPSAGSYSATVSSGGNVVVDLMQASAGMPFTANHIVSITPSAAGVVEINNVGAAGGSPVYQMSFTAASNFSGVAVISYTLTNGYGTSAPATVTITVSERADLTNNPEVAGIVAAKTTSIRRFAATHITNFTRRLEVLHYDGWANSQFNLRLNAPSYADKERSAFEKTKWRHGDEFMSGVSAQDGLSKTTWAAPSWEGRPTKDVRERKKHSSNNLPEYAYTLAELTELERDDKQPLSLWVAGIVDFGQQYAHGQHEAFKFTTNGISAGGDYRVNDLFTLGVGVGFSRDSNEVGNNGSSNISKGMMAMLYSTLRPFKSFFIDGLIGHGDLTFDSKRYITNGGGFATSRRSGYQLFGALVMGYEYRHNDWLISPYGRLEAVTATLNQTTEVAPNASALTYFKQTVRTSNGSLGLKVEEKYRIRIGSLMPYVRVEYMHKFDESSDATYTYADMVALGTPYSLESIEQDIGNWKAGIGARLLARKGMVFTFDFTSNLERSKGRSQSILVGVSIPFP